MPNIKNSFNNNTNSKISVIEHLHLYFKESKYSSSIVKSLLYEEDIHNSLINKEEFDLLILKVSNLEKKYQNRVEDKFIDILITSDLSDAICFFYSKMWQYIYEKEALYVEGLYFLIKIKNHENFSELDNHNKALVLNLIALCQSRNADFINSIKNLEWAISLYEQPYGKLSAKRDLIDDLIWIGELKKAEKILLNALELAKDKEKYEFVAKYQRSYSRLLIEKNDFFNSEKELRKSFDFFKKKNDYPNVKVSYIYFSALEIKRKNFDEAMTYLDEAKKINRRDNDIRDEMRINILYSKLFLEKNNFQKSYEYLKNINSLIIKHVDYYTDYLIQKAKVNFFLEKESFAKDIENALNQSYTASTKIKLVDIWLFNQYKSSSYGYYLLSLSTLNTIYLLQKNQKKYIVKLFTNIESGFFKGKERINRERVNKEQYVLSYLNSKSINVPKIFKYDLKYGLIVREYLYGEPLNEIYHKLSNISKDKIFNKIGIWIATFHQYTPNNTNIISNNNLFTLGSLEIVLNNYLKNKKFNFLNKYINSMKKSLYFNKEDENTFLWGSCSIDNIYYNLENEEIIGNDFEFSFLGDKYYDLGRMVMSMIRLEINDENIENLVNCFILGYEEVSNIILDKEKIYLWSIISILINIEWHNISESNGIILIKRIQEIV